LYLEAERDALKNSRGEVESIIILLRDVTDERIEEALKQDFLNLISHKLRTPTTVISQNVSMLKEGLFGKLSEEQKEPVEAILKKTHVLMGLIERLINFELISKEAGSLPKDRIELSSFLPAIINPVINNARNKKIELNIDCRDKDLEICMHKEYFKIIIEHLVENAIKFNDKEVTKIQVSVEMTGRGLEISVSDNGPGIPIDEQKNIFTKFYQIEKEVTGQMEGFGLGLALAKRLMDACAGKIEIQSNLGQGAEFTLIFPKIE
jgi:signal transduction histidine kinase